MEMVDTALESSDFVFLIFKSLGTIGVPYVVVLFYLQVNIKFFMLKLH